MLQTLAGNATVQAAVALAAKRAAEMEATNGSAIHGCAVEVGGAKEKGGRIQSRGMQRAHVTLGLQVAGAEVVALAAEQPQALMIPGDLALGHMLATQNEHLLHATTIMH